MICNDSVSILKTNILLFNYSGNSDRNYFFLGMRMLCYYWIIHIFIEYEHKQDVTPVIEESQDHVNCCKLAVQLNKIKIKSILYSSFILIGNLAPSVSARATANCNRSYRALRKVLWRCNQLKLTVTAFSCQS